MSIATTTVTLGGGDYRWLTSARGTESAKSGTLDYSAFTVTDDYIPSGTPVKLITQTGLYGPAATSSTSATLAGFVYHDVPVNGTADLPFALVEDATVDASNVPGTHDLEDGRYICSASAIASTAT